MTPAPTSVPTSQKSPVAFSLCIAALVVACLVFVRRS
jgi:hypothetical protein